MYVYPGIYTRRHSSMQLTIYEGRGRAIVVGRPRGRCIYMCAVRLCRGSAMDLRYREIQREKERRTRWFCVCFPLFVGANERMAKIAIAQART